MKETTLADAVEANVRPGDTVQVICGHTRWTAAARELVRQFWGEDPGFTLVMVSLSALGALFFQGGLVRKVITTYSGDTFPTYGPNPVFRRGYESGDVEVEHWSILTFAQRLEAAARGLPAVTTGSLAASSMEDNAAYCRIDSPFGELGLLAPLAPDVALVHAPLADREGNLAISEPLLEGVWGAWAARRGVVATAERIVDSLEGLGHRVRLPAHRVLAVVEAPYGAHPGGCFAPELPCRSYGEDIAFWTAAAEAARSDLGSFARQWVLGPADQEAYLAQLGTQHLSWLESRSYPDSWREDDLSQPLDTASPPSDWEVAAAFAAREVERVVGEVRADAVLAGAGVANLAAWVAVGRCRAGGSRVTLTAELGLWGYEPTPADPYIFNHRVFPGAVQLSDASTVLGLIVGGSGTRVVGCLGAAQVDAQGNLNSTLLAGNRFLVGSGGANDVASRASAVVVVTLAHRDRLPAAVDYVTSPGRVVDSVVTERGLLRRLDGELRLAAVPQNAGSTESAVRAFRESCGWELSVCPEVEALSPIGPEELSALRNFDRQRLFLR